MEQHQAPLLRSTAVPSMRDLCLKEVAKNLQGNIPDKVQELLSHLPPDEAVEALDQALSSSVTPTGVCPYRLLLPRPGVLLQSARLRGNLLRITRHASADASSRVARDALLLRICSAGSQTELTDVLEFGTFLCEMGWHEDGMIILEKTFSVLCKNVSWQVSEMALDCVHRQLAAETAVGRVGAAGWNAGRMAFLNGAGLGLRSGLQSAAAAAQARLALLTENWPAALRWLVVALDSLPAAAPADLAAELPRLVAELLLSCGCTAPLVELAPQALSASYRHWGQLHPQTLAAARVLGDFALLSGFSGRADDISQICGRLAEQMYAESSPLRQRLRLDRLLLEMKLAAADPPEDGSHSGPQTERPATLQIPSHSCWTIDLTLADCQWVDDQLPLLLNSLNGFNEAAQLGAQTYSRLRETERLCEELIGPASLRLSRVLTQLARLLLNLELDQLLPNTISCAPEAETLLRRALDIQAQLGVPSDHRDSLVTRLTLASLHTYSSTQYLLEAERLMKAALRDCHGGGHWRHLDLAEHCLRGLSAIYARHEDAQRAADMDDLLETVQALRRRLAAQRLPPEGLAALLPPRPWSQREMRQQLMAALRRVATVVRPDKLTVVTPHGLTVVTPE
ncbi:hypothetical protein FJT64_001635 [Amphibalanus amphitrite]|uniref:Uncharacterized protein n=1 Tax=Amphibalanus amphitrite TaxID=1232801 RepID=A0A6A4X729_AMPAM|nr:hypothetical protein FJT64_001635 [Amphibalanus amphitrite]